MLNTSDTWLPLPLCLPSCSADRRGKDMTSQTSPRGQEERPGREAAPKIVDLHGGFGFVSKLGLDLSMGSVLHCSSKRITSQPLSPSLSVRLSGCLRVMSSWAGTGARPLTVWCMPWPQVLHDSVDVVSCASIPSHPWALALCGSCIALPADPLDHYTTYIPDCIRYNKSHGTALVGASLFFPLPARLALSGLAGFVRIVRSIHIARHQPLGSVSWSGPAVILKGPAH